MENQVMRRRMNLILGHFAGNEDISFSHVFPLNCSSSINTVFRRRDSRVYFARQGSSSQACFMRQVSTEQGSSLQPDVPLKSSGSISDFSSDASEAPLFSKPARKEPNLPYPVEHHPVKQERKLSATDPPKFARLNKGLSGQKQFFSKKIRHASGSDSIEWSPRMDVAESGFHYAVTVELPGISINDIRVEVNDQNLTVMGKRSTQWWQVASCSNDSISEYHKREILQGPYQVVWRFPIDVNKDRISAEFVNGFLQITIPKL